MVTEAGKELLRNSINTANFHNKIIEQNEMWKQWEIERGLTMMVSDDDILKKIRKNHRCSKHQKMAESQEWSRSGMNIDTVAGTSSADRWDHNGFKELYPDETAEKRPLKSTKEQFKKWGHSGFHKLYPDESRKERSSSASSSSKSFSKKCDRDLSSDEDQERQLAASSGKKCKKKCTRCGILFYKDNKEKQTVFSNSKKHDEKSNHYSYEDLYRKELCKQGTLSPCLNKHAKRAFLSSSPRRSVQRSLSPSPREIALKSNHHIYEEQCVKDLHKRTSLSPCLSKRAKRPSLSFSPRRLVRRSSSPIERVMKSNHYSYEEQYHKEMYKRTTLSPYINKHSKRPSLSFSPRRRTRRRPSPRERVIKWDHNGFLEMYPEERLKKKSSRLKKV
ncbi:uncharacterized protein NKAPD1 isoform X2 [Parasteatoda tepidariorum]|uniref:uncharacterized protein NKAPD1 isoform X2 n=1 Tax=Parasteatoda tepidariorum TaxID=114398 RepID=UPI0039BD5CC2